MMLLMLIGPEDVQINNYDPPQHIGAQLSASFQDCYRPWADYLIQQVPI